MKNSTKVRLHLSKKLFESLTREIIKEAKANDGYTVAVKQPKAPKVNELFGLGAKGVFKPGQRVKYKGQGGWMVDKFLGKKDELEKYSIRDASGSGKYLEVIGNEITVDENSQMNEIKRKVMPTLNELRKQIKNK